MKRIPTVVLVLVALVAGLAIVGHTACTNTPNLTLCKPAVGDTDVLTQYNGNFDKLDAPTKLVVSGVGPHAIGTGTSPATQVRVGGTFNGSTSARAISIESTLGPAANSDGYGIGLFPTIAEAGSGTHPVLAALFAAPSFTNAAATATDVASIYATGFTAPSGTTLASTIKVASAPTGGGSNYALHVAAGTVQLDGNLQTGTASTVQFGARLIQKLTTPTYGTSVAIDASLGNTFRITATNGTAFTVANPTSASTGQRITVMIRNASGGALGTVTWDTLYKQAGFAVGNATNGNSTSSTFVFDGSNWVQITPWTVNIPN